MAKGPTIITLKCNGCGLCVDLCNCGALVLKDNVATFVEMDGCNSCDKCRWCGQCELVCPEGAISYQFDIINEG